MKKIGIVLFQLGILFVLLIVLLISGFILPNVARDFSVEAPEWAYLRYPLLISIYITLIPFVIAVYEGFVLSRLVQINDVFSLHALKRLSLIKNCAFIVSLLYLLGTTVLSQLVDLSPGIAMLGIIIMLASLMIGLIAGILEELLRKALEIKIENDLTV